jgi:hypothetical protein
MSAAFEAHRVAQDDPEFVYDRQVDFKARQASPRAGFGSSA